MSIGILILRLVIGLTLAAHGAQKLFGWFGGYGLAGTGGFLEQLGFVPGRRAALAAAQNSGSGTLEQEVLRGIRQSLDPKATLNPGIP